MSWILGLSAFYHDSAAVLLRDGQIVAAAQEERFTRIKHDDAFPANAIAYCLAEAGIVPADLAAVGFYEKPLVKFHRLLETYAAFAPAGLTSFTKAMSLWLHHRLHLPKIIRRGLPGYDGPLLYVDHHESHAAAAFLPSPFERAAILTVDGVGEWSTATVGQGEGKRIRLLQHLRFPHSLGLLYSAFTYYAGFQVNSGEYKLMGLAPYANPAASDSYAKLIREHLIDLREDGSFRLDLDYFNFCQGLTMTSRRFHRLFGGEPRPPEQPLRQRDMDLAGAVQQVTEEAVLKLARHARQLTGETNLCLAGGVSLNCVANGQLLRAGIFDQLFVQPAAGDAGGALGTALFIWHQLLDGKRQSEAASDRMQGALLGPAFDENQIRAALDQARADYRQFDSRRQLADQVAELLDQGQVVGLFQGRMEFGPRALGARSILGDPRNPQMQRNLNLKIKFRESFRPFAPIVMAEHQHDYFDLPTPSPYMLRVGSVLPERRLAPPPEAATAWGIERLNLPRSDIPAVTHVDYSARIQTVDAKTNPLLHQLLDAFRRRTGCAVLVNTSFNVRGEPIVCTPADAIHCFANTAMDALAIENFLLLKTGQNSLATDATYQETFRRQDTGTPNQPHAPRGAGELWREAPRQLRGFAWTMLLALVMLGAWQAWQAADHVWPWAWTWPQLRLWLAWSGPGALLVLLARLAPPVVRPLYVGWMLAGQAVGWMVEKILLAALFYLVLAPLGLLYRRWTGVVAKHPDRRLATYWESKTVRGELDDYYHPF